MQTTPPKYQGRPRLPEKTVAHPLDHDPTEHDLPEHEEEQPVLAIRLVGTSYAKDCIPTENNCNVTAVTDGETETPADPLFVPQRFRRQDSSR